MKTKKYVLITLLFISMTLAITLGINYMLYAQDDHLLSEGITISGVDVSHLTKEQAKEKMEESITKWLAQPLELRVDGDVVKLSLADFNPTVDLDTPLNEAYTIGRKASLFSRTKKVSSQVDTHFELGLNWDDQHLSQVIEASLAPFRKDPIDASFTINNKNLMDIQPEHMGRTIDTSELLQQVKELEIFQAPAPIKVDLAEVKPAVTAADLEAKKIDGLIASYTTWFDATNTERTANVHLSAEALDGKLIEPGQIISFNEIVGERTGDKGYQDALIVVNGEFVPGLGGGICQTSSTLYNVGLLANLKITERRNHGLAVAYVPLGRDATVVYGALDLKMSNSTDGYLLIRSKIGNGYLTIDFYGKTKPNQEVVITNQVEEVIPFKTEIIQDPKLAPGTQVIRQNGQNGYIASATRIVKINGQVVETQSLGKSSYVASNQIIAKGPALPPTQPKPTPKPNPEPEQPKPELPKEPETPTVPEPEQPEQPIEEAEIPTPEA